MVCINHMFIYLPILKCVCVHATKDEINAPASESIQPLLGCKGRNCSKVQLNQNHLGHHPDIAKGESMHKSCEQNKCSSNGPCPGSCILTLQLCCMAE